MVDQNGEPNGGTKCRTKWRTTGEPNFLRIEIIVENQQKWESKNWFKKFGSNSCCHLVRHLVPRFLDLAPDCVPVLAPKCVSILRSRIWLRIWPRIFAFRDLAPKCFRIWPQIWLHNLAPDLPPNLAPDVAPDSALNFVPDSVPEVGATESWMGAQ